MVAKTGFQINGSDFNDVYVRAEYFTEGGLWLWGSSNFGQLGDNTTINKSSPVQTVAGGTNWKQVACGIYHTAVIKSDGALWTWGYNQYGQLGDNTTIGKSSPVQTVAAGTNWKQVSSCFYNTAAVKTDGTLWIWGDNTYGELGDNTVIHRSSPVQTVAGGTNWKQVTGGFAGYHTAAIKSDGTLWAWGRNNYGQLGDNTIINRSSPVQTVAGGTNWKLVASGFYYTAAIKTDGTLWMWGQGSFGQLGNNTSNVSSSPVQTVAGGTNWKQIGGGSYHVSAVKTDGTLWTWGLNSQGALGDNTIIHRSSPVQTIAGGTNWKQSNGAGYWQEAIKTDGTLWAWGHNTNGTLGDNTIIHRSSPIQTVAGGTNWKLVSGGLYFTAAIRDQW